VIPVSNGTNARDGNKRLNSAQTRFERAAEIVFEKGAISRLDEHTYHVRSQSGNGSYVVMSTEFGWKCSCPDHQYQHVTCKHIIAITYSIHLRREVEEATKTVIAAVDTLACKFCNSVKVVKDSLRHNKYGDIQRYLCKACGKTFSFNIGFEGMRASPQIITTAMQLYFSGESLRGVQKFVKLQGLTVSHATVLKWIRKYVRLMDSLSGEDRS
jgi:transposase-like protein